MINFTDGYAIIYTALAPTADGVEIPLADFWTYDAAGLTAGISDAAARTDYIVGRHLAAVGAQKEADAEVGRIVAGLRRQELQIAAFGAPIDERGNLIQLAA